MNVSDTKIRLLLSGKKLTPTQKQELKLAMNVRLFLSLGIEFDHDFFEKRYLAPKSWIERKWILLNVYSRTAYRSKIAFLSAWGLVTNQYYYVFIPTGWWTIVILVSLFILTAYYTVLMRYLEIKSDIYHKLLKADIIVDFENHWKKHAVFFAVLCLIILYSAFKGSFVSYFIIVIYPLISFGQAFYADVIRFEKSLVSLKELQSDEKFVAQFKKGWKMQLVPERSIWQAAYIFYDKSGFPQQYWSDLLVPVQVILERNLNLTVNLSWAQKFFLIQGIRIYNETLEKASKDPLKTKVKQILKRSSVLTGNDDTQKRDDIAELNEIKVLNNISPAVVDVMYASKKYKIEAESFSVFQTKVAAKFGIMQFEMYFENENPITTNEDFEAITSRNMVVYVRNSTSMQSRNESLSVISVVYLGKRYRMEADSYNTFLERIADKLNIKKLKYNMYYEKNESSMELTADHFQAIVDGHKVVYVRSDQRDGILVYEENELSVFSSEMSNIRLLRDLVESTFKIEKFKLNYVDKNGKNLELQTDIDLLKSDPDRIIVVRT